jgi:hypothetical protein
LDFEQIDVPPWEYNVQTTCGGSGAIRSLEEIPNAPKYESGWWFCYDRLDNDGDGLIDEQEPACMMNLEILR